MLFVAIVNQDFGYLVFGVEDKTHIIKGTTFKPKQHPKGKEELEHWLAQRLDPMPAQARCWSHWHRLSMPKA